MTSQNVLAPTRNIFRHLFNVFAKKKNGNFRKKFFKLEKNNINQMIVSPNEVLADASLTSEIRMHSTFPVM